MKPHLPAATAALASCLGTPALAEPPPPAGLFDTCLESPLSPCLVTSAGYLTTNPDAWAGGSILWQVQSGTTTDGNVQEGFVLWQLDNGEWRVLDSDFDLAIYLPPRMGAESLLHLPGRGGGVGVGNLDRLYRWTGDDATTGAWHRIDTESWWNTAETFLPEGSAIWKGVSYDFDDAWLGPTARTPLWRADDAHCCPTGEQATIGFAIENDTLTITGITLAPPTGD